MFAQLDLRGMIYRTLQPAAKAIGCKMFIADVASYYNEVDDLLEKKARSFGFYDGTLADLREDIREYGCVVILKSPGGQVTPQQIAGAFAKFGVSVADVKRLDSPRDAQIKGMRDADPFSSRPSKEDFDKLDRMDKSTFYWFNVEVNDGAGGSVYDKYIYRH